MKILAVSEYWIDRPGQGLGGPSALLEAIAGLGHEVHLLSAKPMLETSASSWLASGMSLEFLPGPSYVGHDPDIDRFVAWAAERSGDLKGRFDRVVSFCPWVAAEVMVLNRPYAPWADRQPVTGGARDRLLRWALGRWHPRTLMLRQRELAGVGHPLVRSRVTLDETIRQAWQRERRLPDAGWALLPMAANGPRYGRDEQAAARRRLRQAFGVSQEALVFGCWSHRSDKRETQALFDALSRWPSTAPEIVLFLAGNLGYAQQRHAAERRIRSRIRVIGWTARTSDFWSAADVAIALWPMVGGSGPAIEGLGSGLPLIAPAGDLLLQRLMRQSDDPQAANAIVFHDMSAGSIASAMQALADVRQRTTVTASALRWPERLSIEHQARALANQLGSQAGQTGCVKGIRPQRP